ncbi:hydantoinase/oxoprolinase N-terminal domain-containing protein [Luteimonas sp. RIT-PG2_3]
MRLGVDVGGTNTDAVLMEGSTLLAWTKQSTTTDVSAGVVAAIAAVLDQAGIGPGGVTSVMIGTTHFANALVERRELDRVGILRLASPSGESLPPMTGWPSALSACIGDAVFLLPGGYEVDGREIAPLDDARVRDAARALRHAGIEAVTISSAFAPMNAAMEEHANAIVRAEHPAARITLSSQIGRLGLVERENASILNAALSRLAAHTIASFDTAIRSIGITAPLYISQNDGTLISHAQAAAYPMMTIGSGPTNSMRGAAFLTGLSDAIVMDVGGTTTDIGVLGNGFPRESSIAVDIGGVRTNSRMPDILSIGLGGGTRIHLDAARYGDDTLHADALRIGPDSVGYRLSREARVFGGQTLTASDIAIAAGVVRFGDPAQLPALSPGVLAAVSARLRQMLEDGIDRMKTSRDDATILAVGGGGFLIPDTLKGASQVIHPQHAAVANAVGAAIAQVGAQIEQIVDYDSVARPIAINQLRSEAYLRVIAAGGDEHSVRVVEIEEVFLSYLPGRSAQLRIKAIGDLAGESAQGARAPTPHPSQHAHAH